MVLVFGAKVLPKWWWYQEILRKQTLDNNICLLKCEALWMRDNNASHYGFTGAVKFTLHLPLSTCEMFLKWDQTIPGIKNSHKIHRLLFDASSDYLHTVNSPGFNVMWKLFLCGWVSCDSSFHWVHLSQHQQDVFPWNTKLLQPPGRKQIPSSIM